MLDRLHEARSAARQRFDKIVQTQDQLQLAGRELGQLLSLGDLLSPDDVIKTSANLVGGGIGSHVVAAWLSEMPQTTGDPLMAWVSQHVGEMQQGYQALTPLREQARHELGLSAMRALAGHHLGAPETSGGLPGAPQPSPSPSSNPLVSPTPLPNAPSSNSLQ